MNKMISKAHSSPTSSRLESAEFSAETRQLISLGQKNLWDFRILGKALIPANPVRLGDWLLVPAQIDTSLIPARTLDRIQTIFAAGIRPKGFVMVHEAPKWLPSPSASVNEHRQGITLSDPNNLWKQWGKGAIALFGALVAGVLGIGIIAVGALAVAVVLALPATLLVGAATIDPILVAVTDDGYWIEIDRWWNEAS